MRRLALVARSVGTVLASCASASGAGSESTDSAAPRTIAHASYQRMLTELKG